MIRTLTDTHGIKILWLDRHDMPEAAALEALCFSSGWTAVQFFDAWTEDWFAGYGLFEDGRMLGYIVLSVVCEEMEVLNIAIHPEYRGRGLSYPLMFFAMKDTLEGRHLLRKGKAGEGWTSGYLEVRVGNAAARALYESLGFREAGSRKKYYADGEDALIMTIDVEHFRTAEERRSKGRAERRNVTVHAH